jgi:hypothetical protein
LIPVIDAVAFPGEAFAQRFKHRFFLLVHS